LDGAFLPVAVDPEASLAVRTVEWVARTLRCEGLPAAVSSTRRGGGHEAAPASSLGGSGGGDGGGGEQQPHQLLRVLCALLLRLDPGAAAEASAGVAEVGRLRSEGEDEG
jgi:hypothetical protein